jgi:hypothetical protein
MNGWALLPIGAGATASSIGAVGLAAALFGTPNLSKRDRAWLVAVMAFLVGGGAVLSTLGAQAAARGGRQRG